MIEKLLNEQFVEAIGWTLFHSLWQGAIFAIAMAILLIFLRSYSAHSRYIVSTGLILAFFATTSATFWQQWQEANYINELAVGQTISSTATDFTMPGMNQVVVASEGVNKFQNQESSLQASWTAEFQNYFNRHLPLLVTLWFLGFLFLQLRFLGQLVYVQRLKHYGTEIFPESWSLKIEGLEKKLKIKKQIAYLSSIHVESPMVVGWIKPVVLIPKNLFNKLSETEIYAVLAHELAHIRREDFFVNILQTFLCNIFFFHPGVNWMSNRIDDEREHCCDDLAIKATGQVGSYARTLINVSELSLNKYNNSPAVAMSFGGKSKKNKASGFSLRIKRLFKSNHTKGSFREGFATASILMLALIIGVASTNPMDEVTGEPTFTEVEESFIENNESSMNENAERVEEVGEIVENESDEIDKSKEVTQIQNQNTALVNEITIEEQNEISSVVSDEIDLPNSITIPNNSHELENYSKNELPISNTISTRISGPVAPNKSYANSTVFVIQETSYPDSLKGIDKEQVNEKCSLHSLTSEGKMEKVKSLIEKGADVNVRDDYGRTLLHLASAKNYNIDMRTLIDLGIEIDAQDNQGRTALMYAAAANHADAVALLISTNADVEIGDVDGMRAYEWSKTNGNSDLVKFLDLITSDKDVFKQNYKEYEKELEKEHEKANKEHEAYFEEKFDRLKKSKDIHELFDAIEEGSVAKCREILKGGVDVNDVDEMGKTALMIASRHNDIKIAKFLIAQGANVNQSTESGFTALHYAALDDHIKFAEMLLSNNAKIDATMRYASTDGLGNAIRNDHSPVIFEYIGATPLLIAVESDHAKFAAMLLSKGADPNHSLSKREYLNEGGKKPYLTLCEVIESDREFLTEADIIVSIDDWTPYKQAEFMNETSMLKLFSN